MLKIFILAVGVLISLRPSFALSAVEYKTSIGAVFTHSRLPAVDVWVDPAGNGWTTEIGVFSNDGNVVNGVIIDSDAIKACAKVGAELPTLEQFAKLELYFASSYSGKTDYDIMFPRLFQGEARGDLIWTRSDAGLEIFGKSGNYAWPYAFRVDVKNPPLHRITSRLMRVRCVIPK